LAVAYEALQKKKGVIPKIFGTIFLFFSVVAFVRCSAKRETHSKSGLTFQGSLYSTVFSIKYRSATE